MTIYASNGAKLFIGGAITVSGADLTAASFSAITWTEIGETENLGQLGDTSAEITFDGIGSNRTRRLKGTRNAGAMEVVCGFDSQDAGQLALIAAEKTIFDYAFKLVYPDAPAVKTQTVTITIATPGVVSWTAHGLPEGTPVVLTTAGVLPTGLTAATTYYVKTPTTDAFSLSATPGGAAITTSGTQSGVHTATTVPVGTTRLFAAKVMAVPEVVDAANNVIKQNATLGINSNIVGVARLG
jgi:hypothetical protein